jgi:HEAT repeat protein
MDESRVPPSAGRLESLLVDGETEAARESLKAVRTLAEEDQKRILRRLRSLAQDRPTAFEGICPALVPLLEEGQRAVRLTTAKVVVAVASARPDAALESHTSLADRLADDEEFYYVRARCAEALGYLALEYPETVGQPEVLAELRVGLAFDEPEVRAKLAKALEYIALGEPDRLRHQVSNLAEQLSDDDELVRYHLTSALLVIGCQHPDTLAPVQEALAESVVDENTYVRGRAAEALGVVAHADVSVPPAILETVDLPEEPDAFLTDRVRFAREAWGIDTSAASVPAEIGTIESVRGSTDEIAEEIRSPDAETACSKCDSVLPEDVSPICPRCGTRH